MTDTLWITIPNWDRFQHYHDRKPTWIKLYLELADRDEWRQLTLAERGLLCSIWVEYAAGKGLLRQSELTSRVAATTRQRHLDSLVEAGFIQLSASKPVPIRYRISSLEKEKDKERPSVVRKPGNGAVYLCTQCAGLPFKTQARLNEHRENVHGIYTPTDPA